MSDTASGRRRRALEIFDEIADLDGREREARLAELCDGDDALRAQVDALLAADATDGEPFSGNVAEWGEALGREDDAARDPMLGRSVGAWRIVGIVGRGGMGAVYAVERSDGAYAQQAALKLIRASADSLASRQRFLRERQILAQLQHPNIATLLDGGISAEGEPWFVMELIDGEPIDRWCDERGLGLRERIVLFLQVLDAVRFAHRNLVVHRDLKPSNLLVDADGRVKLLDFGIAKQLEEAEATATMDRALTFQYASPEQLHDAPITTASDLWQLGVILHRLLSGSHPFGLTHETPVAKQLRQLEREPEPLTRAAAHASAEQAAQRGGLTPITLARALRGNLAEIVHTCLRHDPGARYASADAMANDLKAWLDNRPIAAVPLSRGERAKLWLRRNRVLAASGTAVALALLVGTGVALWQAREARTQARIAQRESASAHASLQFLTDTLAAASPDQAMSKDVSVRQLLDKARAQLAQKSLDPQVKQSIQRLLGHLYESLGEPKVASELFAAGLKGVEPAGHDDALALALDIDGYSNALGMLEKGKDSLAAAMRSADLRSRFAANEPEQQLLTHKQLGNGYLMSFDLPNAEKHWVQALTVAKTMPRPPVDTVIDIYNSMGDLVVDMKGEYQRGVQLMDEGLGFADSHGVPAKSPLRVTLLQQKAEAMLYIGNPASAEALLRQAIDIQVGAVGERGQSMGELQNALGNTLNKLGRHREALASLQQAYDLTTEARDNSPLASAIMLANIGQTDTYLGDYPQALAMFDRAFARLDQGGIGTDSPVRRQLQRNHVQALISAGRFDQARALLSPLLAQASKVDGVDSAEYAGLVGYEAMLAMRTRDGEHGRPLLAEAQRRWAMLAPPTHAVFAQLLRYQAAFEQMRGSLDAAEHAQREALARLEKAGSNQTATAIARAELAGIRHARGDDAQARALLQQAMPILRDALLPQEVNRAEAEALAQKLGLR